MVFEVANINCQNCANTIKNELKEEFGEIFVDLTCQPRKVEVNLQENKQEEFKKAISELGFEVLRKID